MITICPGQDGPKKHIENQKDLGVLISNQLKWNPYVYISSFIAHAHSSLLPHEKTDELQSPDPKTALLHIGPDRMLVMPVKFGPLPPSQVESLQRRATRIIL